MKYDRRKSDFPKMSDVQRVTLEKIVYQSQKMVDTPQFMCDRVEATIDEIPDLFNEELNKSMFSLKLALSIGALREERLIIDKQNKAEIPDRPIDALACMRGFRWLQWFFTVQYRTISVEVHVDEPRYSAVCPHIDVSAGDKSKCFEFLYMENSQDESNR